MKFLVIGSLFLGLFASSVHGQASEEKYLPPYLDSDGVLTIWPGPDVWLGETELSEKASEITDYIHPRLARYIDKYWDRTFFLEGVVDFRRLTEMSSISCEHLRRRFNDLAYLRKQLASAISQSSQSVGRIETLKTLISRKRAYLGRYFSEKVYAADVTWGVPEHLFDGLYEQQFALSLADICLAPAPTRLVFVGCPDRGVEMLFKCEPKFVFELQVSWQALQDDLLQGTRVVRNRLREYQEER